MAEVTGASVENVKLAHKGETVIGEIMGDVAHQAYHGQGQFEGQPQKILAVAVMYPNILQVVSLESSGVRGLAELAGKTVSVGAPGSGTAFMSDLVFSSLGIGGSPMMLKAPMKNAPRVIGIALPIPRISLISVLCAAT